MNAKSLAVLEFGKIRRRLADHTAFSGGRQLALDLEPASDAAEVRQRLGRTTQARDFTDRRGDPPLGGAHDMRPEVEAALRGRALLPQELLDIRDTIQAGRRMRQALERGEDRWPDLAGLAVQIEPCPALFDAIQGALDDDGEVRDSASPKLERLRRELRVVRDRLMRQLEGIVGSRAVREHLQEALITQRDGRYVVPVKSEFRSKVPGVVHDTSDSGATVFVEPMATVEAGNRLRELEIDEEKEVSRILRDLSGYVAAEADALGDTIVALSELDLAFACAHLGAELRAVPPLIPDSAAPIIDLPAARHPLLDPLTVVPVSVRVGEGHRLLVITGPNTGGKTVTLKTIGLLVLMAQSGLHVPAADGARLSVFDGVYADIGDEQSIEQSLSTFSGHMTNIIALLQVAGPRSLVLLDELGAGTDPVEGAALAEALLEHLRQRAVTTVASTHYSELKVYAHATPDVANASVEFDVETLRPTFELTIGLPGRSNALAIARRLGLPEEIVEAARGRTATSEVAMEDLLAEIRTARADAVADRSAAAEARRQADEWAAKLETALRALQVQQADAINAARRQATAELEAAQAAIRKLLRRASAAAARDSGPVESVRAAAEEMEELSAMLGEELVAESPLLPEPAALHPGQHVRVLPYNKIGEVLRLLNDEVEVQMERLRLTVGLQDVEIVPASALPVAAPASSGTRLHRAAGAAESTSVELDLRGLRVDEGLDRVDAYLDDAVLAGLPFVRIIHGHGTGAMRAAVRDQLKHHPQVVRSRPGERGEGGDGVTVVYLEDSEE